MKNLRTVFSLIVFSFFLVSTTQYAQANEMKLTTYSPSDCMAGLINLNVDIDVEVGDITIGNLVDVGDITVQDLVNVYDIDVHHLINVEDILSNNDIDVLDVELKSITIDNVLTNVLRDANIISGNHVVVGILNNKCVVKKCKRWSKFW